MATFEGSFDPPPGRFALVAARFNQEVVNKLIGGAVKCFLDHHVDEEAIDLVWVPGSFEIPLVAQRLAATGNYAALVCLGAVIKGETDHYEHVAHAAATGVLQAGLVTDVPVLFGILTCQTEELAFDRAGGKAGNKGFEAAQAAIEMVNLLHQLPGK